MAGLEGDDAEAVELYKVVDIDVDGALFLVDDGIGKSFTIGIALAVDGEGCHFGLYERQGKVVNHSARDEQEKPGKQCEEQLYVVLSRHR